MSRFPSPLLLLGRDHPTFGDAEVRATETGKAAVFLSVGTDPDSPSMQFKGDRATPNEDAVLVWEDGPLVLLAVADGHRGTVASHAPLEALARGPVPDAPLALDRLLEGALAEAAREAIGSPAGAALTVVVADRRTGALFGRALGDCTALVFERRGARTLFTPSRSYLHPADAASPLPAFDRLEPRPWSGGLVVLHTDGVDGCHYGHPRTSVRPSDIEDLHAAVGGDPTTFVSALGRLALGGVEGAPGGQDNVAIAAAAW